METRAEPTENQQKSLDPFRRAVLRGLGVLLPPLLTIVIFLWVGNTVSVYLLDPLQSLLRDLVMRHYVTEIRAENEVPDPDMIRETPDQNPLLPYQKVGNQVVPSEYYDYVLSHVGRPMPQSAEGVIAAYVDHRFFSPYVVIPVFLCGFLLVLYLLGKFLAAGVGKIFWGQFERLIHRLPLVRNVYSSVKQVTDFMFSEREIEYTRVVAVEYPRKGIWTIAFVTGESMLDIRSAANEPVLSVLIPTSPMPFTGFTITIKKSETVDLNITVEQAVQFVVSCGVVVPPQQMATALASRGSQGQLSTSYEE